MHIPLIVILLIILLLLTFYFYDGQAAANKVKDETIAKERLLIKRVEDYVIAKQDFKAAIARMLKKTEEVYIYTNDKAYLELTMRPNRMPKAYNYLNDNEENLELLQSFLGNKHYGFSVKINRSKTKFTQMWLHDSVIPTRYAKKFRVVKYYKMTPEEIIYNKERDKKRIAYRQNPRNDKVYAINRGIVDFNELKNKKFFKKTREIFTPRDIDLTRKNNYFYFSSLNANVSEKEFLEAVKEFNKMFIKKGNPNKLCFVKKYKVRRE